eukprot:m.67411 g.67411  ORF g.67411 m.67411 type:complete len:51 (-) comp8216_c0_seq4:1138-1290(-)
MILPKEATLMVAAEDLTLFRDGILQAAGALQTLNFFANSFLTIDCYQVIW